MLRPGIENVVAIDLETLKIMIIFAKRYPRLTNSVDMDQVYAEFRETVSDELDYLKEASHAEKFKEILCDDRSVYVPEVFRAYTTQKVLTLEFVEGYKINDFSALEQAGLDKNEVAENLLSCYLRQVLIEGFYHADPHSGNLLVRNDGVLILLDFGMVGRVNESMKKSMINLAMAMFKKDAGADYRLWIMQKLPAPHNPGNILKVAPAWCYSLCCVELHLQISTPGCLTLFLHRKLEGSFL